MNGVSDFLRKGESVIPCPLHSTSLLKYVKNINFYEANILWLYIWLQEFNSTTSSNWSDPRKCIGQVQYKLQMLSFCHFEKTEICKPKFYSKLASFVVISKPLQGSRFTAVAHVLLTNS